MASYTNVTITGYNTSPPPDDGSQTSANRVTWSTIKTKLPDPLKTAIEAIDTNVDAAFTALGTAADVDTGTTNGTVPLIGSGDLLSNDLIANSLTFETQINTTSGSSATWNGIPTDAKKVVMSLDGVSTNGTAVPRIRLGRSAGLETSGYQGSVSALVATATSSANFNTAFDLAVTWAATTVVYGAITFTKIADSTDVWACSGVLGYSDIAANTFLGGSINLAGDLEQIALLTNDAFDAGTVNIMYE